ncbi:MAG: LolA family protein [Polyangiaceae bacterium]
MKGPSPLSRRAFFGAMGAGCLLASEGASRAQRGRLDDWLARVARARAPVRTMKGPFIQTRTIGLLSTDVRSHGSLALLRPDRLRWRLDPPDAITFWVGPLGLAYQSARGQGRLPAGTARIAAALQDLRALLGGDLAELLQRWQVNLLRDDPSGAELEVIARAAVPESTRVMRLTLAPDLVRPVRALLEEGPRDRTVIEFGEIVVNAPLDAAAMRPPSP